MSTQNPLAEKPTEVETAPEATAPAHTILIVDDSATDRHLAGAIARQTEGWQTVFASNGKEALAALQRQTPDVVLTDMLMPEMDGVELVQTIRIKHPMVPVIL